MTENNKPKKVYRAKTLSLSLWEREGEYDKPLRHFSFQKSYKDSSDEWQTTHTLSPSDLPILKTLIDEAYRDILIRD